MIKSTWDNQKYKMTVSLEDVRVSVHCALYCILVRWIAGEETQRMILKYLGREGTEVVKGGETE
jgi:hypothetical protein